MIVGHSLLGYCQDKKKFLSNLSGRSPLRLPSDDEQLEVSSFLMVFLEMQQEEDKGGIANPAHTSAVEAQNVAEQAAQFGERIAQLLWETSPWNKTAGLKFFRILPPLLEQASKALSQKARVMDQRGVGTVFLVAALLVVRSVTGAFNDEEMAELA